MKLAPDVRQVSAERIRDEITKLLTEGSARRGFELLDESGLLREILPEISRMKGVEQPPQFHPEGDVWVHTLLMLERLAAGSSPTLAWGVLLHDVRAKPPTFTPPVRSCGPYPVRQACGSWRAYGGGDLSTLAIFQRGYGTDRGSRREPYAF